MSTSLADVIVATLRASGVQRVYGIPGDSLNGLTDAIRRAGEIAWEHVRHEEAAAFAASGEAAVTGRLAVCAASCGPGNLHLVNGLFEATAAGCPCSPSRPRSPPRRSAAPTSRRRTHRSSSASAASTPSSSASLSSSHASWRSRCARRSSAVASPS